MEEQIDSSATNDLDSKIKAQLDKSQLKIDEMDDLAIEARLKRKRKRVDGIDDKEARKKVRFEEDDDSDDI